MAVDIKLDAITRPYSPLIYYLCLRFIFLKYTLILPKPPKNYQFVILQMLSVCSSRISLFPHTDVFNFSFIQSAQSEDRALKK